TDLSTIDFAIDAVDGEPVVLKRIQDPELAERELTIMKTVASSDVPNVIRMKDSFRDSSTGLPVMVFPQLKRFPVGSASAAKMDLITVAKYLRQLLMALAALHELCIAHLDVTPSNLMLEDDETPTTTTTSPSSSSANINTTTNSSNNSNLVLIDF
ncbi:hypothetical protein HK102_010857, partial [Quaeritorhiza haematococci]